MEQKRTLEQSNIVSMEKYFETIKKAKIKGVEDQAIRNMATSRAANDPLPGPLFEAFLDGYLNIRVSKGIDGNQPEVIKLRPLVAYDFLIFKLLNSPIYRQMLESAKKDDGKDTEYSDAEASEMIVQFMHPCDIIKLKIDEGRKSYREWCVQQMEDKYMLSDIERLMDGIGKQIVQSFSTMLQYGSSDDTKKDRLDKVLDRIEQNIIKANKSFGEDGIGWWLTYIGKMMKYYPTLGYEYILKQLPVVRGWALISAALESDGFLLFSGIKCSIPSYIAQEADKLVKQIKNGK